MIKMKNHKVSIKYNRKKMEIKLYIQLKKKNKLQIKIIQFIQRNNKKIRFKINKKFNKKVKFK